MADAPTLQLACVDPALQQKVEQFLYLEAELLDQGRLEAWIGLLADDLHYVMPLRTNRSEKELQHEFTGEGEMAYLDESKTSLRFRMRRVDSGLAWAENPPSRTRRLIGNVRIRPGDKADELKVHSAFMLYRTRLERQLDVYVGERQDVLRRVDTPTCFEVASRRIVLDQATMLAANLSVLL